ncbi:MAG: hypothetical protein U9Q76_05000, partial [candidate division WOR-3 bacterium]|nr:hypothetical protein [candidate division WOR-3 bacterium]
MSKKLFAVALIFSFAVLAFAAPQAVVGDKVLLASDGLGTTPVEGGSVSWASAPKAIPNGWYWMYDNTEPGPPFSDPTLAALPGFVDITADGSKLAPYSDQPYKYIMPDSFWYYGYWYEPGDYLYISPDGWVSLDPAASAGFPDPPTASPPFPVIDAPNAIMAALWQDMNPTQTPDPSDDNRVYYLYNSTSRLLYVQWHNVQGHANTHTYDFEASLTMGGQEILMTEGECGVVFSFHFIHFFYNTSSNGWTADNGKTGIENQSGEYGIYYQGTIANGRRIRAGYKRIFKHDVKVARFLSPGKTVLRWTEVEPKIEVHNVGGEVEHFPVTVDIYDEDNDSLVYHFNVSINNLLPGAYDTIVGPCWTPGELYAVPDTHFYRKVAFSLLERDECKHNDTLEVTSIVHCDAALGYDWNFAYISPGSNNAWILYNGNYSALTYYNWSGGLITGGRVYIEATGYPGYYPLDLQIRQPRGPSYCGQTDLTATTLVASATLSPWDISTGPPLGWSEVTFDPPIFVPALADPTNIWAGVKAHGGTSYFTAYAMLHYPPPDPCYGGAGPGRGALIWYGNWYWGTISQTGYINNPEAQAFTPANEIYAHLSIPAPPAPPCYYENPHDLTCYRMEQPASEYVEADVPITPELVIANIGLQAEPDADFFSIGFIAVEEETSDTAFDATSLINHIGFLGDPADDPDTLFGTTETWTPEGLCDKEAPFVYYELIGYVLLGRVGPDYSDHCPYNDTIRRNVMCLLSHDVGVIDMTWPELPDEEPDNYDAGSKITVTATVENFGINSEHDVEVRLEVRDVDSNDVLLWHSLKSIPFLNWRGNQMGAPYTTDVTFPTYDVLTDRHHQKLECRTELLNDDCPDDDKEVRHINTGIAETPAGLPFALDAITPNPFVGSTTISFAVPATVNVS